MEEGIYILLGLAVGFYLLVGPGLGIAAFFRGSDGTATELTDLRKRVQDLSAELARLRRQIQGPAGGTAAPLPEDAETAVEQKDAVEPTTPPEPEATESSELWPVKPSTPEKPSEPASEDAAATPAAPPPIKPGRNIEQWLTSRGLIWLGGITLALAGLFLAKYTYERGWLALGPGARVPTIRPSNSLP